MENVFIRELGSKADYEKTFADKPVGLLIREVAKLDKEAADKAFATFLNENFLTQQQSTFVKTIVDYVVQNGYIDPVKLNSAPFDRPQKLVNLFDSSKQEKLIKIIETMKDNAVKAVG